MFEGLSALFPLVVPFLLVLFRVVGIFAFVPVFNNGAIPGNVKTLLGLAMAFCVWNVVPHGGGGAEGIRPDLLGVVLAILGELSVGLLIGLLVGLVFTGLETGANMISVQMGISTATLLDPAFQDQSTVVEQVAFWLGVTVFLALGGHRQILAVVVWSYQTVPMGHAVDMTLAKDAVLTGLQSAFCLAVKVAAPAMVAFFLSTITMGLIGRSIPQVNLMSVSTSMNLVIGLVMLMLGMTAWAVVSTAAWRTLFERLEGVFVYGRA